MKKNFYKKVLCAALFAMSMQVITAANNDNIPPDMSNVNIASLALPENGGSAIAYVPSGSAATVAYQDNVATYGVQNMLKPGTGNRWNVGGSLGDIYAVLTFQNPQTINKLVFNMQYANRVGALDIEYSEDGTNWVLAHKRSSSFPSGKTSVEFSAFTTKYLKLYLYKGTNAQPNIYELELYNEWRDPLIETSALKDAIEGQTYSDKLASRGRTPITWSLTSGSTLPAGTSLSTDGTLSGTPTTQGVYEFSVTASNSYTINGVNTNGNDSRTVSLTVRPEGYTIPIELNIPATISIPVGEIRRIKAADGTQGTVTTADATIVSIANNGFVVAEKPGKTTVTVQIGTSHSGTCEITVTDANYGDIESMRRKYRETLLAYNLDMNNPNVVSMVNSTNSSATSLYNTLKSRMTAEKKLAQKPWDIDNESVTNHYSNVSTMVKAFLMPGAYYRDPVLYDDIVTALDWLLHNAFRRSISNTNGQQLVNLYGATAIDQAGNTYNVNSNGSASASGWYANGIGIPNQVTEIFTLLADTGFPQELFDLYMERVHMHLPSSNDRYNMTSGNDGAANYIDYCKIIMAHGLLTKSTRLDNILNDLPRIGGIQGTTLAERRVRQAAAELFTGTTVRMTTGGNGYSWDGSYLEHNIYPYALGYGVVCLDGFTNILRIVDGKSISGAPIEYRNAHFDNLMGIIDKPYLTSVWKGAAMPGLGGRGVSRSGAVAGWARSVTNSLTALYPYMPVEKQGDVKESILSWVESMPEIVTGSSLYQREILESFIAELKTSSVQPNEWEGIFAQNFQSRVFWRKPDFAFSVSTNNTSAGIAPHEAGNSENIKGTHTSDGMTYLFLETDTRQYTSSYFATFDGQHTPGSTVEMRTPFPYSGAGNDGPNTQRNSKHTWAGTSVLKGEDGKQYGATGFMMDMSGAASSGSNPVLDMNVTANKSWFLLDDKIIALGSNITSTKSRQVDTSVESRRLPSEGGTLTFNGGALSSFDSKTATPTSYAHLSYGSGSQIGYYLPMDGQSIQIGIQNHTDNWKTNNTGGSSTNITEPYADIYINHGVNPTGQKYEYVILPNYDAVATANFAASPQYEVVSQTATLHAVYDRKLKTLAVNNFANTSVSVTSPESGRIYTIDKAASVIIKEYANNQISIAILDPTTGSNSISVTVKDMTGIKFSGDSNVSVTQVGDDVKVTVTNPTFENKKYNTWQAKIADTSNAATFDLTVNATTGGVVNIEGGSFMENMPVSLIATPKAGYKFVNWESSGGTFQDASNKVTTFTMPAGNATVTANFISATDDVALNFDLTELGKNDNARFFVEGNSNFPIDKITYTYDVNKLEIDANGNVSIKDSYYPPNGGEDVIVEANIEYYTGDNVITYNGFENGHSWFGYDDSASKYRITGTSTVSGGQASRTGRYGATPVAVSSTSNMPGYNIVDPRNKKVVFWYYDPYVPGIDNVAKSGARFGIAVSNDEYKQNAAQWNAYGVDAYLTSNYGCRLNNATYSNTFTNIGRVRSAGWHKFEFDITQKGTVDTYNVKIDGVATSQSPYDSQSGTTVRTLILACMWMNNADAQALFPGRHFVDDIYVLKSGAAPETKNLTKTIRIASQLTGNDKPSVNHGISVYPNPVKAGQTFTVNLGNEISDATVSIYSISGVKLSEQKVNDNSTTQTINNRGIYIVEVKKKAERYISKVVIN